jgi:chromate transporter
MVLFAAFLRLGATAFGGPTMVAYIRDLAVKDRRWLSEESFREGVALCQSIPGATAMQTAAYVGMRCGGVVGALAAFVGFGMPAFTLMLILSVLYQYGHSVQPVISAFHGLQAIVIAIMVNATIGFGQSSMRSWRDALLAGGSAIFLGLGGSPAIAIGAAALLGTILYRNLEAAKPLPDSRAGSPRREALPGILLVFTAAAGLVAIRSVEESLFDLGLLMTKVDVLAFGGGYASVPLMLHEVVEERHWMDAKTLLDGIALGQVTPGPIVITATFVGYQVGHLPGALIATVAVFSPSFIMVALAVPFLDRLQRSKVFRAGLRGPLVSFAGLLLVATVRLALTTPWSIPSVVLGAMALIALRSRVDILWVVLVGAAVSVAML